MISRGDYLEFHESLDDLLRGQIEDAVNDWVKCESCGEREDQAAAIQHEGKTLCRNCAAEEKLEMCTWCGEYRKSTEMHIVDGSYYCPGCWAESEARR